LLTIHPSNFNQELANASSDTIAISVTFCFAQVSPQKLKPTILEKSITEQKEIILILVHFQKIFSSGKMFSSNRTEQ